MHINTHGEHMSLPTQTTRFTKANLHKEAGGYVMYRPDPAARGIFVARFKYRSPAGSFMTLLRKKFTVEEYFARLDAGEAPLEIAESKGYISPHIKKLLKKGGYPLTPAGKKQWLRDQVASYEKRRAAQPPKLSLIHI